MAGVSFSQTSVICFCRGFSNCPFHRGFRYSEVSAGQESRGVLPMMAYTDRLRPKEVPFSGFRYMKRVGILPIEVYEKGREICHLGL